MGDEKLYLKATNEVEGDQRDPALWAKVMALSEGNQEKAKYQYIKLRVEQLAKNQAEEKLVFTKKTVSEFDLKYMPIAEFSRIKSILVKDVIEMIRDGDIIGQSRDNEWFVSREDPALVEYTKHRSASDVFGSGNFFLKLSRGDFGLAKTYWLYGTLVDTVFFGLIGAYFPGGVPSPDELDIMLVVYFPYKTCVLLGLWRGSDKYTGSKVWAVLAKITAVWGLVVWGWMVLLVFL